MEELLNAASNKKPRSARASLAQMTKLLDFCYSNKGLAKGKFQIINGKEEARKKWTELSEELNVMRGAMKNPDQCQVVWRDVKSRTSVKARQVRKAKCATGNFPITSSNLNEFEQRVTGLVGSEYVEGSRECADSIPEEEELQDELIDGNTAVLTLLPRVASICSTKENAFTKVSSEAKVNYDNNVMDPLQLQENRETNDRAAGIICGSFVDEPANPKDNYLRGQERKMPNSFRSSNFSTGRNVSELSVSGSANRTRIAETLHSALEHFQAISQGQADVMMVNSTSEAEKLQAEASMMNAHALTEMAKGVQKLADAANACAQNKEERVPVMARLVEVLENLLPTYLHQ